MIKTLIIFLYDSNLKNQKIFIEDYVANLANIDTDFEFTKMDWKEGHFI